MLRMPFFLLWLWYWSLAQSGGSIIIDEGRHCVPLVQITMSRKWSHTTRIYQPLAHYSCLSSSLGYFLGGLMRMLLLWCGVTQDLVKCFLKSLHLHHWLDFTTGNVYSCEATGKWSSGQHKSMPCQTVFYWSRKASPPLDWNHTFFNAILLQ